MSTATAPPSLSIKPKTRLLSIDVLRGLTVAFMILVNNNGNNDLAYRSLNHSPWNGFTPTDLVFPTFLFIMGISMVLSFSAHRAKATSNAVMLTSIVRRFVLLVFFGLVVNGFPYFHLGTLRIYGVLQRIAVCYLLAALLQLVTDRIAPRVALFIAAVLGYWVLLRFVPVPGHGVPGRDFPLLDHDINLVAWLDRHIFPHRLFELTRDPEGLLSDLPAFGTTLLGLLAGAWIKQARPAGQKLFGLLGAGIVLVVAGLLWSQNLPLNKKLWTSSYVLYAGGLSMLLLAVSYYIVEIRQSRGRWTYPLLVFGTNAITAYVISELLSSAVSVFKVNQTQSFQEYVYLNYFMHLGTPALGSLVYSILFVAICFIPAWLLHRKRIFIKL
ncbi:acyltransferase family protein [Granulicella arctica]|uniref:Putative acyltransferase n=1 Tax=Granulicella arctica TaxID=940613 RepID=A0A7Y9TR72_9BACT|nr:heparan-alpha-glucosaminide N-acetyltransferase domain-containing protein [Granulicella arctica]NYF77938.1 putative acyltransferase [Granulicella arctica]